MNRLISFLFVLISIFLYSCKSTSVTVPAQTSSIEETKDVDEEFTRSTQGIAITKEEFNADKTEILSIISEMSKIMADYNYNEWLSFIEPASIKYWSNSANLLQASKRLPVRGQRLYNLNDYFTYVFVPSRKGRSVEEIRYISRTSVKAVQVREDTDIVYYNFVKINGKWMVKIPPLSAN